MMNIFKFFRNNPNEGDGDEMTQDQLDEINRKRRERNKREISMKEARLRLVDESHRNEPGFDMIGFLIGYETGLPVGPRGITGAAMVGSLLHTSPVAADGTPSNYSPPPPNYDSSPREETRYNDSSPSYDSSPSSSYDSGSSSSDSSSSSSSSE